MIDILPEQIEKLANKIYNINLNITEEMLLERFVDRYRWPKYYIDPRYPTLERLTETGEKVQDFFWDDGFLQTEKLIDYYNQGYTIIISGVQFLFKDITKISDILMKEFGQEINANCYLSKGTKCVSFPSHNHDYAVIIKNVFGKSEWEIDRKCYLLENQNVFFIDKFKSHCVEKIHDRKCSLTFNLAPPGHL